MSILLAFFHYSPVPEIFPFGRIVVDGNGVAGEMAADLNVGEVEDG